MAKLRILIGDCNHDSDKGGEGILAGMIHTVRAACDELGIEPEIRLMFRFSRDDPKLRSAARHTSRSFPDLEVLPSPISSRRGPGLHWLTYAFKTLLAAPIRLLLARWCPHETCRAIRWADVVLFKGGHFYASLSANALVDAVILWITTYPLLMTRRLGKPFSVLCQTFGPFREGLSRWIVRKAFAPADFIGCREAISRDIMLSCGLSAERTQVVPDSGFCAYPVGNERADEIRRQLGLTEGKYAAVTVKPWFRAERRRGDLRRHRDYIEKMAALCDDLVERHVPRVALVVQNDGAHNAKEADFGVVHEIHAAMKRPDDAVIAEEDYSFDELTGLYAGAVLTLGTRLHSCIFSLAVGTPSIAVSYSHKAEGIMPMAGAGEYVLKIEQVELPDARRMIDELIARRDELSPLYRRRVRELTEQLRRRVVDVLRPFAPEA